MGTRAFARVDASGYAAFRAAFGALLVVLVARYFLHGWIDAQFHEPRHFFPWPGLEGVRPWPRPWMHVHFAALGLLGVSLAAGWLPRVSALLFGLGFTYVWLIDRTNYLNHYYLISLLCGILAVVPAGRTVPAWGLGLLRFQVGVVYFFAGVAKLGEDWLLRGQPLRLWLLQTEGVPALHEPGVAVALSWAGAAFDLAIPFLLLARRTRLASFGVLVLFHAATAVLFPIGLFPWVMVVAALVFFPPDWPRRLWGAPPAPTAPPARPSRALVAALAAYALLQVVLPFRHWLYPGDVLWNEEGFRFSWRVMLTEKAADARFFAEDLQTGRVEEVRIEDYLTPVQARQMSTQPDLIRHFGRLLERRYRAGGRQVRVRPEVWASLNGRPAAPMTE
jgi:hypothetical protein